MNRTLEYTLVSAVLSISIAGCGGGAGGAEGPSHAPPTPPESTRYSVGGTVAGLNAGATVVLRVNSTDSQNISQNGSFTFVSSLAIGANYLIEVLTNPQGQSCTLSGASGTIQSGSVTNVSVVCQTSTVTTVVHGAPVSTFAGIVGDPGANDGKREESTFSCPMGIAFDGNGGFFVADAGAQTVRRISAGGDITTLAGSPLSSYNFKTPGRDGQGANATFGHPAGIAADKNGNVYVSDPAERTVRKITADGTTTTFAGNYPDGTVLTNRAVFNEPFGVATDGAGNVYVTDDGANIVFKITPAGFATTLAGQHAAAGFSDGPGASALFNHPLGLAVDRSGNVFVSDSRNNVIRKITADGVVSTIAGQAGSAGSVDGSGTEARFNLPSGIAVDASGTLFVVDSRNQLIRQISPSGAVTTLAGVSGSPGSSNGYGISASFYDPYGVAVDNQGAVYVGDCGNKVIRKIVPNGNASTTIEVRPPTNYPVTGIVTTLAKGFDQTGYNGIAVDIAGNIYDSGGSSVVRKTSPDGSVTILAGAVGARGYVDAAGAAARFEYVAAIKLDSAGNLYVANDKALRKVSPSGVVTTVTTVNSAAPFSFGAFDFDASGNIYTINSFYDVIWKVTPSGAQSIFAGYQSNDPANRSFDGIGTTARFQAPTGILIDPSGNTFVADSRNSTIRKISPAGIVTTVAGRAGVTGTTDGVATEARFTFPTMLAQDRQGNLYVADLYAVRKVTPDGLVTTVAGIAGQSGSADGVGMAARFSNIGGIAVDTHGVVYVADNGSIRKIVQQ